MKKKTNKWLFLLIVTAETMLVHFILTANFPTIVRNFGVSFGLKIEYITLISGILVAFMAIQYRQISSLGLALIMAGAMSNILDRLRFGFVADYWQIPGTGIYNNLNDWLIALGVIWLIIELWRKAKW